MRIKFRQSRDLIIFGAVIALADRYRSAMRLPQKYDAAATLTQCKARFKVISRTTVMKNNAYNNNVKRHWRSSRNINGIKICAKVINLHRR